MLGIRFCNVVCRGGTRLQSKCLNGSDCVTRSAVVLIQVVEEVQRDWGFCPGVWHASAEFFEVIP